MSVLVAAALGLGLSMILPTLARAVTRTVAKSGVQGEDIARAVERIEKSDRIKAAMGEAWDDVRKTSHKIIDVPLFGDVRVADVPIVGEIEKMGRVKKTREIIRRTFDKYGIKYDDALVRATSGEILSQETARSWSQMMAEVMAAGMAGQRVSQAAQKIASRRGTIYLHNPIMRKKLIGAITREAAIAGAAEGAANTIIDLTTRYDLSMFKPQDRAKYLAGSAGMGAATGALTSGIAGYAYGNVLTHPALLGKHGPKGKVRQAVRKTVDWSQELLDIQEKPGDIIAEKIFQPKPLYIEYASSKYPRFLSIPTPTPTPSPTLTADLATGGKRKGSLRAKISEILGKPTGQTPTGQTTPLKSSTITPAPTPTETTTTTPTPTPHFLPSPAITPTPKHLPMPLTPMPYKEVSEVYGTTLKNVYVNELERLKRMMRQMVSW